MITSVASAGRHVYTPADGYLISENTVSLGENSRPEWGAVSDRLLIGGLSIPHRSRKSAFPRQS